MDHPGFASAFETFTANNFDPQRPAASLNYMLVDENFNVMEGSGAIQTSGSPGSWNVNETAVSNKNLVGN